jgi:hypothetical protein
MARQYRSGRRAARRSISRYGDPARFHDEAAAEFDGDIVVAQDLMRVAVPARIPSGE